MSAVTVTLNWTGRPTADETARVLGLLAAADATDDIEAVGEAVILALRPGNVRTGEHLLATDAGGTLVGYAHLGSGTAELGVHPEHRRRGTGGALLDALVRRVGPGLWAWAHGEHPAALRLAERHGMRRERELWQLRRSLRDLPDPWPLPDGVRLRAFVPGRDEAAVVRVNNRAFAGHPEQAGLDVAQLQARQDEPWFDPAGFLLAEDEQQRLLGFHWTKVHPDRVGEVYVLGIDPDAQGTGLGAALTVAGLEHLAGSGLGGVLLYVEADNHAAVRTYEKLGFRHHRSDVAFRL